MAGDVDADVNEVANNEEEHKKCTNKKVSVDSNHAGDQSLQQDVVENVKACVKF